MDVNVLRDLFSEYNAHKEEILDKAADRFISKVRKDLEERYDSDRWAEFIGCTQLGISIEEIDKSFKDFKYHFGWILKGETLAQDYEMHIFNTFFFGCQMGSIRKKCECSGYQGKEIETTLKPFVDALQRKGFEAYYDEGNQNLIVAFNIVDNKK